MKIRPIKKSDNAELAKVLRTVLREIGADSDGFAYADPQLDQMFEYYEPQKGDYYVLENTEGIIVGGAGFDELSGEEEIVELQKMYFLPEARGKGFASEMLKLILNEAKHRGFKKCYLETLDSLQPALKRYEAFGFEYIDKSCGNTGHFGCNVYMIKTL